MRGCCPEFLDRGGRPRTEELAGVGLVGAYDVDEEGVPGAGGEADYGGTAGQLSAGPGACAGLSAVQRARTGRGCRSGGRPALGVLKVSARDGATDEELNKRLLESGEGPWAKKRLLCPNAGWREHAKVALSREFRTAGANWCAAPNWATSISARCVRASRRRARPVDSELLWRCAADGAGPGAAAERRHGAPR